MDQLLSSTPQTPRLPLHIDSTMMVCFRSCAQKFYDEFVLGLRPGGISIDLHAGACFASALEETYTQIWKHNKSLGEALIIAEARFFQEWGDVDAPDRGNKKAKNKDRVWEAVEYYFAHWSPKTDPVRPYFNASGDPTIEYTFAIPLEGEGWPMHPSGGPFIYCGRFDMLGNYNGRPAPKDDKTTGASIGQNWTKQWDLRSQFIGYIWACQQCGIDAQEVIVRGLAIQITQFVPAEAIKTYSQHLIAKWLEQLRRDLTRMVKCYNEDYWDYNLGDTCTAYGLCPYMDACASPHPEAWLTNFEVRHWNPLNKNPVGDTSTPLIHSR